MRELFPEKICGMALKKEKKIPIFYDLCYTNSINLKFYRGIAMERSNQNRSDTHGIEM